MKDLYILDALSFLFRSYYAIRQMTNEGGESTNALYGFIRSVQKIVKDFSPSHLVVVFDGPDNKQARTKIYPEYKANRTRMPEDLVRQLDLAMDYCKYAGIPYLVEPNVEADIWLERLVSGPKTKAHTFTFALMTKIYAS